MIMMFQGKRYPGFLFNPTIFYSVSSSESVLKYLFDFIMQARFEKVEREKDSFLLMKLSADGKEREAQNELLKLMNLEEEQSKEREINLEDHQRNLAIINDQNNELKREIQKLQDGLAAKLSECEALSRGFRLKRDLPEKKLKFMRKEDADNDDVPFDIRCLFNVAAKIPFKVQEKEALVTFEEEDVAQKLIGKGVHIVNLDNVKTILKANPVTLETGVTFELHMKISRTKINVSDIPDLPISEEWMRDKLELNFYKSKLGGGEVEKVEYDSPSRTAVIAFTQPGVAEKIVRRSQCPFLNNGKCYLVSVFPVVEKHLEKFQMFSGISKRTILLTGIKEVEEDEESIQDMIEIHFQKPSHGGGEVENIKYFSERTKVAYFEEDAENTA
uniref:N-myc and STAT interactor n=1 Tax=Sphenodon punctatus TaxID=8508 RepID=A0A8D0G9G0_SPHPU